MTEDLALIQPSELSLVDDNSLNAQQLKLILKKTPKQYVHKRPAKGGGEWEFVTGGYVQKVLNLMFGFDWDFEVMEQLVMSGEVIVKGKLTCRTNGKVIVKSQFGNKDIIYKKLQQGETERQPLSIGNDMKAAATDCLKKCASQLGIAADIYNKLDFKEVLVDTRIIALTDLKELFDLKKNALSEQELSDCQRVIDDKEENSYFKIHKLLSAK